MKNIFFIIPTHNRNVLLKRTLLSLLACRPVTDDFSVEVVIVENGGRFGAKEIVAGTEGQFPCTYLYVDEGNKSVALNHALEIVGDSFVVFLDDDVRVSESLVESYVNATRKFGTGHFFGGGMLVDYETPPAEWLLEHLPPSAKGWLPETYEGVCPGLWFMGCNWGGYAEDIRRAGAFDCNVGPGGTSGGTGQEASMQQKLVSIGVKPVFLEDALVWHFVPDSRSSVSWTLERAFKNAITTGLTNVEFRQGRSLARIPLWLVRRYCELTINLLFCKLFNNKKRIFHTRLELQTTRGLIKGSRLARRNR